VVVAVVRQTQIQQRRQKWLLALVVLAAVEPEREERQAVELGKMLRTVLTISVQAVAVAL
jgi:hypothetical protein